MNIFTFHIVILLALVACWLTITGRVAEWNWRLWRDSRLRWLFLGAVFSDLRTLKRFHFWLGWIILTAVLFVYFATIYHWSHG